MNQGRWLVVAVLVMALGFASVAWWYHANQSRSILRHWGAETAILIEKGEPVDLFRLEPLPADAEPLPGSPVRTIGGVRYRVGPPVRLSGSRGFLHVRHALVQPTTYRWTQPPPQRPQWQYLLRFGNAQKNTEIVIAPQQQVVAEASGRRAVMMGPMAEKIGAYLEQQFKQALAHE